LKERGKEGEEIALEAGSRTRTFVGGADDDSEEAGAAAETGRGQNVRRRIMKRHSK
jgi:hypothetical protein